MNDEVTDQRRVLHVLDKLHAMIIDDEFMVEAIADMLERGLNELHEQDAFGTEGQSDPRGDFRNGSWSMTHVEDLDD